MKQLIFNICAVFCIIIFCAFTPASKYIKKAEKELDKGHITESKQYYHKALELEPENYHANLGLGLILCELQDNYSESLPYLEMACRHAGKDTLTDLKYALAKCYQVQEKFDDAIYYLNRLNGLIDYDNEIDFTAEIKKRIADCVYAKVHANDPISNKIYIVNAGKRINTEMPEYVPIIAAQNGLIFTSKRKDDEKENINYLDGKYFESIYISMLDSSKRYSSKRYNGLDNALKTKFGRKHESLLSLTSNGNKWFVFADNKIYEIEMSGMKVSKITKLGKSINFNTYQNHAFLSQDGKSLYFTSDAGGGKGGNDIYVSKIDSAGEWKSPVSISDSINTVFDEEAPFLSADEKTLYFASKGHPGFGNFDMYKSELRNGQWSKPENLGKPYNSSASDLFFVSDSIMTAGYFSSARMGGYGDMDIYKIIYIDKIDRRCVDTNSYPVQLAVFDENRKDYANAIKTFIPPGYQILSYNWSIDNVPVESPINMLEKDYQKEGTYQIGFKLVALCDTCFMPVISCSTLKNKIEKEIEVVKTIDVAANTNTIAANNNGTLTANTATKTDSDNSQIAANDKSNKTKKDTKTDEGPITSKADKGLNNSKQETVKAGSSETSADLLALGFNPENLMFSVNSSSLSEKALEILSANAKVLIENPKLKIDIFGYADPTGSREYNTVLSNDRAHMAWVYLIKHGVKRWQIKTVKGMGTIPHDGTCKQDQDCLRKQNAAARKTVISISKS
ncbi:MAG: OmpA family protein [Bacteroidota bacterium]